MPHAPPFGFLAVRFALSARLLRRLDRDRRRRLAEGARAQWLHLAVIGLLMQAGYLGGVWAAVKSGHGRRHRRAAGRPAAGADGALADAQQRGARRLGVRRDSGSASSSASPALAPGRLEEARRRGDAGQPGDGDGRAARHHHRHALPEALRRAVRRAHRQRRCRWRRRFVVCLPLALLETEPMDWHLDLVAGNGLVGRRAHARRQLAAVPADPARRGDRGDEPALPGAALHRVDGVGYCSANRSPCS